MGAGTSTGAGSVPLPAADLADRLLTAGEPDRVGRLDAFGRSQRDMVLGALPRGWSFQDKRVLDFGCGPGTLLRHFIAEAHSAEFYGWDIDAPSIAWLERHLSPPLSVFVNDDRPPLPLPDRSFDLVLAIGVFAQITDQWSAWLAELHRILVDGGADDRDGHERVDVAEDRGSAVGREPCRNERLRVRRELGARRSRCHGPPLPLVAGESLGPQL